MNRPGMENVDPGSVGSKPAIEARLDEMRKGGSNMLECMISLIDNQGLSMHEAMDSVVNSNVWADRKDDFLRQQEEAFEEYLEWKKDEIEEIRQEFTPGGTKTVIKMKAKPAKRPWWRFWG